MIKQSSILALVGCLFCGASLTQSQAQEQAQEAQKKGYSFEAIPLTPIDQSSVYFIPTTVEGKPVNMLLDTGAGAPFVFSTSLAQSLHKKLKDNVNSTTASGSTKTHTAVFTNIRIGERYGSPKINALIIKLNHLDRFKVNGEQRIPDGLVGAKFLSALRAVLDFEHDTLLIPPAQAKNTSYAFSRKAKKDLILPLLKGAHGYHYINIKISGQTYAFLIDSAATVNTIDPAIATALNLKAEKIPGAIGGAGSNTKSGQQRAVVHNLLLGGKIQLANMNFYLIPGHTSAAGLPAGTKVAGIFGSQTLKNFGAKLDFGAPSLIFPRANFQKK